jgi:hypothetical protein
MNQKPRKSFHEDNIEGIRKEDSRRSYITRMFKNN